MNGKPRRTSRAALVHAALLAAAAAGVAAWLWRVYAFAPLQLKGGG